MNDSVGGDSGLQNQCAAVNANNEIEPWLEGDLGVRVPKDLKAASRAGLRPLVRSVSVQT